MAHIFQSRAVLPGPFLHPGKTRRLDRVASEGQAPLEPGKEHGQDNDEDYRDDEQPNGVDLLQASLLSVTIVTDQ